ncbi:Ig-like domain repeat protein, partial [Egicoccus sp. AB-alg6-2]|uniref:Ig-like domain repeat protein n=1 Tax=Egicoccus sp. AB-alg6-2 TaxID=3242692 RepID=UPI00359E0469
MLMTTAGVAAADEADNNALDSSGNTAIAEGGSTSIRYWIVQKGNDGGPTGGQQGNCNARPATPTTVAILAPSDVTVSPSSLTFTECGDANSGFQTVSFSSAKAGSYAITHRVTDTSSGETSNSADFTLRVTAPATAATSLGSVSGSGTYGGAGTLTATLTAGGAGVNGKSVAFTIGNSPAGSATTNSSGVATLTNVSLESLAAGSHSVGASFAGDSTHSSSTGSGTLAIAKAPTTTTVTCPASVDYSGSAITPCSAQVTGAGGLNETLTPAYTNNTNTGTASASASFAETVNYLG